MPLVEKVLIVVMGLLGLAGIGVAAVGGILVLQDTRKAVEKINETPATGCCLETRDGKFIRVVGDCSAWRLAIPGCQ